MMWRAVGWRRHVTRAHCAVRRMHSRPQVKEALASLQQCLARGDFPESAPTDARALVANALRPRLQSSSDVFFHSDRQMTEEETAALADSALRRSRGEPLAYITGEKEFWSMAFAVTPDTLIPRADSEILIETLVELYPRESSLRILDVGTGSGCLLLAALSEFPQATGVGIDISAGALAVAKENASRHDLADRSTFLHRDLADLSMSSLDGIPRPDEVAQLLIHQFDVIICNPPYIPRSELPLVGRDVVNFEPHTALFSDPASIAPDSQDPDPEGLRMYRLLFKAAGNLLDPATAQDHGLPKSVIVEIGSEAQADAVRSLFDTASDAASGSRLSFIKSLFDGRRRHRGLLFQAPRP